MQPDTITLAVDTLNSGSTTDYDFKRFEETLNRTIYAGENHAIDARDQLAIYRTAPRKTGNFKGVAKTSVKFTKDFTVLGVDGLANLTAPVILEVSFSVPVGCTSAQMVEMRQRLIALLDSDTVMNDLNLSLMI